VWMRVLVCKLLQGRIREQMLHHQLCALVVTINPMRGAPPVLFRQQEVM